MHGDPRDLVFETHLLALQASLSLMPGPSEPDHSAPDRMQKLRAWLEFIVPSRCDWQRWPSWPVVVRAGLTARLQPEPVCRHMKIPCSNALAWRPGSCARVRRHWWIWLFAWVLPTRAISSVFSSGPRRYAGCSSGSVAALYVNAGVKLASRVIPAAGTYRMEFADRNGGDLPG